MNRSDHRHRSAYSHVPRERGDEPVGEVPSCPFMFPASAGMNRIVGRNVPRERGDEIVSRVFPLECSPRARGCSPRARG